jgi:hypothetical protein
MIHFHLASDGVGFKRRPAFGSPSTILTPSRAPTTAPALRGQYDRGDNGEPNRYAGGDEMDTCMLKTPSARRHNRSDGRKRPGNDKRNKGCHLRGRPRPTVGMAGAPHTGMSDGSDAGKGGRVRLRKREGLTRNPPQLPL